MPSEWRIPLALERGPAEVVGRGGRDEALHERHRPLVEGAGRGAVRIAGDPAIVGVGRRGRDAGPVERGRVDPRIVAVAVGQEDRAVRADPVEVLPARQPAREVRQRPAATRDPLDIRVGARVGRDGGQVFVKSTEPVELAADAREARHRWVDMAVAEAWRHGAAAELDDPGAWPHQGPHVAIAAHGGDATPADGQGLRPGLRGIGGEDPSPGQDKVGGSLARHGPQDDRECCGRRARFRGCAGCTRAPGSADVAEIVIARHPGRVRAAVEPRRADSR